uniref:Uncharacterized protein n=1 Tax=Romanomermis culicivorax TaxID=13658 RepID=A0A915JFE3_ROMCU
MERSLEILIDSNAVRLIALIKEQLNHNILTRDALCEIDFFVHKINCELVLKLKHGTRYDENMFKHLRVSESKKNSLRSAGKI